MQLPTRMVGFSFCGIGSIADLAACVRVPGRGPFSEAPKRDVSARSAGLAQADLPPQMRTIWCWAMGC